MHLKKFSAENGPSYRPEKRLPKSKAFIKANYSTKTTQQESIKTATCVTGEDLQFLNDLKSNLVKHAMASLYKKDIVKCEQSAMGRLLKRAHSNQGVINTSLKQKRNLKECQSLTGISGLSFNDTVRIKNGLSGQKSKK
jgi:hypothetical protein